MNGEIFNFIMNVAIMTVWSASVTILSIMMLASLEGKLALAPVNAISHILYGDSVLNTRRQTLKHFWAGLILNTFAMIGWCALAEVIYRLVPISSSRAVEAVVVSIAITVLAFITDFHIVPKRFTPGFEHILSRNSLMVTYVLLALSLIIGSLLRVA